MTIAAVLIATDVIEGVPLALAPWRPGETLIEYHIEQLRSAGVDVIEVVVGAGADDIIPLVAADNVEPIIAARPEDAASTLRAGASAVPRDTEVAVIVGVGEPRPAELLRAALDAHVATAATLTMPAFEGTPGRPVVLGRDALAHARNVQGGDDPLAAVLAKRPAQHVATSDIALLRIETRADLDAARRRLIAAADQ